MLPDLSTRVGSTLLMHRPSQRYLIGPSTWLLPTKQNNLIRMYCLFSWAFVQPFIPPELGAAGILEAPMFPSKIGSRGAHKANRFLARLFFFSGLFERLLFFVLGDSQVLFRPRIVNMSILKGPKAKKIKRLCFAFGRPVAAVNLMWRSSRRPRGNRAEGGKLLSPVYVRQVRQVLTCSHNLHF